MVVATSVALAATLSSVHVALPAIARSLRIDAVLLTWIPMGFLVAAASTVLVFGRLADMFGRKRVFICGAVGICVASVCAATASNGWVLLFARSAQGLAAAMLYATQVAIVSSVYPPERRGHVLGILTSAVYCGLTGGPVIGGWIVHTCGWRWVFLIFLPLTLGGAWIALRLPDEWRAEAKGGIDIAGAAAYAGAIVALMLGVSLLLSVWALLLLCGGGLLLGMFMRRQRRHPEPLFDVELFYTNRIFRLSGLASLIMYTATYANVVLVSLSLQYLQGLNSLKTGFVILAQPAVMALLSPYAGRLSDRIEPRIIASLGMALTGIGLGLLASLSRHSAVGHVVFCLILIGLGFSLFSSPNINAIMGSIDRQQYGSASSAVASMRILGQMCSTGVVALVFALTLGAVEITPARYADLEQALRWSYLISAGLCVPGVLCSMARGRMRNE